MINLASTDSLTLATTVAGAISAHVSWTDQAGLTFTPGSTNTASIVTVATTTILSSPAASTLRNAKFISIFNTHATLSNVVTLRHTDGVISNRLMRATLAPSESIVWDEGRGWQRLNTDGVVVSQGDTGPVDVQTFSATGTWNKPTAFVPTQVLVKIWGPGGGGGGGGAVASTTSCKGGAGGGGGACAVKYFLASELAEAETVTLGAGGSGGIGNLSAAGSNGGNSTFSSFGSRLFAFGGGGGTGGAITGVNTLSGGGGGTGSAAVLNAAGLPVGFFEGGGSAGTAANTLITVTEFGGNPGVGTSLSSFSNQQNTGLGAVFGGSGGGCAGYRDLITSNQAVGPNRTQQACGRFPGGAGVTGVIPTAGSAGAAGNSIWGGSGGGAGGNSQDAAVNGGAGGAGGQGGGGGGGGGLTIAGNTGGAGGAGGDGYCVVISW